MSTQVQLCRRLWLECDGEHVMGNGMIRLLLEVRSQGSLKKAAEYLKMPYRGAWGRIRKAEEALGVALLESTRQRQKGVTLTPIALSLVEAFTRIDAECRDFLQERLQTLPLPGFQISLGR